MAHRVAIHRKDGTDRLYFRDAAALRSSLEQDFGLALPESPELIAMLERISQTPLEP